MHHFLSPFLESIKNDIPINLRDYERISVALQGNGTWTIQRLEDVLLALLVKNKDQQNKFLRRFEAFFPANAQTVLHDHEIKSVIENIKILIQTPKKPQISSPTKYEPKIVPKHKPSVNSAFKLWIPICVVLTICAILGFVQIFKPKPIQTTKPELPVITIEPKIINYDPLKPGQSASQTITIKNKGPGTAKLEDIKITGASHEYFKQNNPTLADELAENQEQNLTLIYFPKSHGIHNAFVDIQCNAKDSPVRAILKASAEKQELPTESAKRLYRNMPYVEKVEYYDLPEKSKDWIGYSGLALIFLLAAIFYSIYLHKSRKVPEDKPAEFDPKGSRYFSMGSVGGKRSAMLSHDLLDHLADSMGYFQSQQISKDVDVHASVKATVKKCGIPEIVFSKRKQVRALLVLEDSFAESSAWNTIVEELVKGMRTRGVPVIHGMYDSTPNQFKTKDKTVFHLEDLEDQRSGFLVLIFSETRKNTDPNFTFAMERLSRWHNKAWLNYNPEHLNHDFAMQLQKLGIPVFPACSHGIYQAIKTFLTEQGTDLAGQVSAHASGSGNSLDLCTYDLFGTQAQIPERFDVYVEYLLGDALAWAQDCAMIQPCPVNLADAVRKKFHSHLPPERLARVFALPDTTNTGSGLRFSVNVQTVLRTGFKQTRKDQEQEKVLQFIFDEIQKAKPKIEKGEQEKPGLDYLKWESAVERLRLELDGNNDLERFAALAKSPLGSSMIGDLEQYDFEGKHGKIPLRVKPKNKKALQRLADLAGNPFKLERFKLFPIKGSQWAVLFMLIFCFLGFSGKSLSDYIEWQKPVNNSEIVAKSYVICRVDRKTGTGWKIGKLQIAKDRIILSSGVLTENIEYRMILYQNGYRTINNFKTQINNGTRIFINREDKECNCKEEFSEIGLTVLRCNPNEIEEKPVDVKTWEEILGKKAPVDRMISIGLEFSDIIDRENPSLSVLRDKLFETGSVDILYQVQPGTNGKWNLEQVSETIHTDLPFLSSQLIWWQANNYISSLPEKIVSPFLTFQRIVKINVDDNANWRAALARVFEPDQDIVVTENEIFAALGKGEKIGEGGPIALIRPKKEKSVNAQEFSATLWKTLNHNDGAIDVVFSSRNFFVWSDEVIIYDFNFNTIWSNKAKIRYWPPNIAISPNEKIFAYSYYKSEKDISIYDLKTKTEFQIINQAHSEPIMHLAFSPDGKLLASGSQDKTVKIWKLDSGKFFELQTLKGHSNPVVSVSFSPDGKFLASGSRDNTTVKIWKLDSSKFFELQTLKGHSGIVGSVSFSPDGKFLASASADETVKIWKLDSGKFFELQTLKGHSDYVVSVSFSPDGKFLASASSDETVKIWKLDSGKFFELQTLKGHSDSVYSVSFSPDGKFLASGSADDTVKIWKLTGVGGK